MASAPNGAIAVAVADAAADVVSVEPKVVQKAVVTLARVVAHAVVEANALTMRQPPTPAPRAKPVASGPKVAVSGRNEVIPALKPAESRLPKAATADAVAAEAVAQSVRSAMRAPRRPEAMWQRMSCHWPQRPSSIRKPTWLRRVPKEPRPMRAGVVVAVAAVADVIAIRCVQNQPTVSQVPSQTPRRPQPPMRMWPKAAIRCLSLLAKHPTAGSVMAAVAAAGGATAATAKNLAPTGNPAAVV